MTDYYTESYPPSLWAGNVTSATFGSDPVPATLAAAKADAKYGDSGSAKPSAMTAGQYVILGDGSKAYMATGWTAGQVPAAAAADEPDPAPPPPPPEPEPEPCDDDDDDYELEDDEGDGD